MAADITLILPDGTMRQVAAGTTGAEFAGQIGRRLAEAAVAIEVDGELSDLGRPLHDGAKVRIVTRDTEEGRGVLRHSTAHVMAQAVTRLWPGASFAIGPAIADGFYYDFELPGGTHFSDSDLERIEATMREIVAEAQPFVREEHSIEDGLELFKDQPYKVEIIEGVAAAAGSASSASGETDASSAEPAAAELSPVAARASGPTTVSQVVGADVDA
ncbi:MAG: TGS domain-containing protein, partial [Acidimicrobiales bacterium]